MTEQTCLSRSLGGVGRTRPFELSALNMKTPYHLTPGASQGNAFTRHLDPRPSVLCSKSSNKDNGAAVSATLARKRDAGVSVPATPMTKRKAGHYKKKAV